MVERVGITESDLRRLLELAEPARCGGSGEFVPDSLLSDLPEFFGCDDASFQQFEPYEDQGSIQALVEDPLDKLPEVDRLGRAAYWEAFSYPQRSGNYTSITRSTDRLPQVFNGPCYHAYWEARGERPPLAVTVPFPPIGTLDRRLLLWRLDSSDFTDRDVALLTLLRPHLIALAESHRALQTGRPRLTPRQWEILRLVASGRSNRQVARALTVAEGTVRKHLENIYAELRVYSRTEALAKVDQQLVAPARAGALSR
jgi:DNA-binding CsgD family transcriptional regulator